MAENGGNDADRTEEPSQKRLDEAREQGQLPVSRDVAHAALFAMSALLVGVWAPSGLPQLTLALQRMLASAGDPMGGATSLAASLAWQVGAITALLALPVLGFAAAAAAATLVQHGPLWTAAALRPKFERVSPVAGWKRLMGGHALAEHLKTVVKIAAIGTTAWFAVLPGLDAIASAARYDPLGLAGLLGAEILRLLTALAIAAGVLALLDVAHQRFAFHRRMMMTREEARLELRQSEGDPHVRQRQRAIRLERARRRMMADVPTSTVVITNPTHFAVALRYEPSMAAPLVVAKGVDHLALRIREVARAHGVPVIENPPLARSLHAAVELGTTIPPEQYRAVAEVIAFVLRRDRPGAPPHRDAPSP